MSTTRTRAIVAPAMILGWLVAAAACGQSSVSPDAACVVGCACEVDIDCTGLHTACDRGSCTCAAGYSFDEGGACAWTGVIEDPGFQSTSVWQLGPGVVIRPDATNGTLAVDPGLVDFAGDAVCKLSRISQIVTMPKLSRSEPLVIEIRTSWLSFAFGASWQDTRPDSGSRFCLGAAAYAPESATGPGAPRPLTLMPIDASLCGSPVPLVVDRVEVKPANDGECPIPGGAVNGDAEGDGGWLLEVRPDVHHAGTLVTSAMIEDGVGENGTRGARMYHIKSCGHGSASNSFSVPSEDQIASPALSYFLRTSEGFVQTFIGRTGDQWSSGLFTIGVRFPTGAKHTMCLPPSMRGNVFRFESEFVSGNGVCDQIVNSEAIYDNLEVIDEPRCGTNPAIADPGFESTSTALVGAIAPDYYSIPNASIARASFDPGNAHSGSGVLQLSARAPCAKPFYQSRVVVPPSSGLAGPALEFFYKASAPGTYQFRVQVPDEGTPPTLVSDDTYHRGIVCLNPYMTGRSQTVTFGFERVIQPTSCDMAIPPEHAFVDDLAVTTDPSCPSM